MSDHHSHPVTHGVVEIHGTGEHGEHGGHAVHGMLIVGEDTVYLSHLPMFSDPHHHFQAIFEATFTEGVRDGIRLTDEDGNDITQATYVSDRRTSGERVYTLAPDPFFLPDLILPDPQHPRRREVSGKIFRGHFERQPRMKLFDARVHVTSIIHFRQLNPDITPLRELEYILFGKGQELFLAHFIAKPPDFDQVLPVTIVGHLLTDDELREGLRVRVPGRPNTIQQRLKANERVEAEIRMAGTETRETF